MRDMLLLDFETRSRVDLKTRGTDLYCQDKSTDVLCCAFAWLQNDIMGTDMVQNPLKSNVYSTFSPHSDSAPGFVWVPSKDGPMPQGIADEILLHVKDGGLIAAHNARFDQQIWESVCVPKYGFPEIPAEAWYCSSAQARVNALPAALGDACRALNVPHQKNRDGDRLIRLLSIPNELGQFHEDPAELDKMAQYCLDDVLAMRDMMNSCRMMTPDEHADWLANERVNDNGVGIDTTFAALAAAHADKEAAAIASELHTLTDGEVTKHTQNQRIKKWLEKQQIPPLMERLMTVYKNGEKKTSLAKDIREQILDRADTGEIMITDKVYDVIAALDDGNKSSVAKYKRMLERADDEDRVSGAFVYAGASTIRYTSRGLQLHNFKRDCLSPERTEELKRTMATGFQVSVGNVMDTLSKALRPTIVPGRGNVLIVGDFKSIENRGLPWLANSPGALNKLATFKQIDDDPTLPDMYVRAATEAGTDDRQVGKVIELSMGFGGANGAFHSMARNYGVHLPDAIVTGLVQTWRNNNQWAVDFWNGLERAAKRAINNPGTVQECGRVSYTYNADMMGGSLFCELPCGQILTYPSCRLEEVDGRHGPQYTITALKANWKPAADAKEWPRYALWRGLLAENVTQAACASLTRWLVRQFDNVVLHCHDEVALECSVGQAAEQKQLLQTTMETGPAWAKGLPLKAPVAVMARYGK